MAKSPCSTCYFFEHVVWNHGVTTSAGWQCHRSLSEDMASFTSGDLRENPAASAEGCCHSCSLLSVKCWLCNSNCWLCSPNIAGSATPMEERAGNQAQAAFEWPPECSTAKENDGVNHSGPWRDVKLLAKKKSNRYRSLCANCFQFAKATGTKMEVQD